MKELFILGSSLGVDLDRETVSETPHVELVEDRRCEHHGLSIALLMAGASLRRRRFEPGNFPGLDAKAIMTRSKQ